VDKGIAKPWLPAMRFLLRCAWITDESKERRMMKIAAAKALIPGAARGIRASTVRAIAVTFFRRRLVQEMLVVNTLFPWTSD
jgi:hypothetical protein